MKIVSSFMDDLPIRKNQCHSLLFESSKMQMKFKDLIQKYFGNKKLDEGNYLEFITEEYQSLSPKQFYFLNFDCFSVELKNEKDTEKVLLNLLMHELENNEGLLQIYTEYLAITDRFVSQLEISHGDLQVEFQMTEKAMEALLKSLLITIERNEDVFVENYSVRELLIKALLKLNLTEKEVVLLLSFPEVDIGYQDYEKMMGFIKELGITTIILSANPYFLKYPEKECVFLVNQNGGLYDIQLLAEELEIFGLSTEYESAEVAKELAFRDFIKDYLLLDPYFKKFLLSDRENS